MEHERLIAFLTALYPLPEDALNAFAACWKPHTVKRKTILTAAGETERYLYFVLEGVQRAYYLAEDGREATIVFTYPPSFSGIADSFLTRTPTPYFLETITTSHFLRISHEELQVQMQKIPDLQQLLFKATAFALKGALERHIELQCFSNEQKFKTLLSRSPHLLQIVPQKYLASYLGMDATNFSKLLATVRI